MRLSKLLPHLIPVVLFAIAFLFVKECIGVLQQDPFHPLRFIRLQVEPTELRVGDEATLLDGLCNESNETLTVEIYLGAQREGQSTFGTMPIDLLTRPAPDGSRIAVTDTPEGRLRQSLDPGCTAVDPIHRTVPPSLVPGVWRLRAHAIVQAPDGRVQDITIISDPFEVLP
jgi:hypothetical protein